MAASKDLSYEEIERLGEKLSLVRDDTGYYLKYGDKIKYIAYPIVKDEDHEFVWHSENPDKYREKLVELMKKDPYYWYVFYISNT